MTEQGPPASCSSAVGSSSLKLKPARDNDGSMIIILNNKKTIIAEMAVFNVAG